MKRIISYLACVCLVAALIPFSLESRVAAKEKNDTDKRDGIIAAGIPGGTAQRTWNVFRSAGWKIGCEPQTSENQ